MRALLEELRSLIESHVSVDIDTKDVVELMHDVVDELVVSSAQRHPDPNDPYTYSQEQAEKDKKHYEQEIKKNTEKQADRVKRAVANIPTWMGSKVLVKTMPAHSGFGRGKSFMSDDGDVTNTVDVVIYKSSPRNAPGFTLFGDGTIDDVLDAGDTDFFHSTELESDYFALVNEIRHPGRSKQEAEKAVLLYTARPAKDRHLYDGARSIPSNVFLTTSWDEAEGYKVDFGGDRDIWRVWIKKKHLVLTLDRHRLQNYQAYASGGKVPVERIELA